MLTIAHHDPLAARAATIVVAASDSSKKSKAKADYVCDGTADDVQIQAAINALPSGSHKGGTITLLEGIYSISATVNLKASIRIVGQGIYNTALKLANNANCNMFGCDLSATGADGFLHLDDLYLDGNKANNSSGIGLSTKDVLDGRIRDVCIFNFAGAGIKVENDWGWVLDGVVVEYCTYYGLKTIGTGQSLKLSNCKFIANGTHGVHLNSYASMLVNCECDAGSGSYGIFLEGANDCLIIGCKCKGTSEKHGIYLGSDRNVVSSCRFISLGNGIRVPSWGDDNLIISNSFQTVTTPILNEGAGTKIHHNYGFKTENCGTATILSDASYIDVAHGLSLTPSINNISVTPTSAMGSASTFWLSDVGASTFRINVDQNPGQDVTFSWHIGSY